ncbi:MAG: AI-2E family transporter [Candidatus Portnoybacteria bacterium]
MMSNSSQSFNISTSTIFRVILISLGFVFLYLIRDILLIIFISVIIAAAISGPVGWLQRRRVPRLLGVIFIYLVIFLFLALIVALVFPLLAEQIKQLTSSFPGLIEKIGSSFDKFLVEYQSQGNLQSLLNEASGKLSEATSSIFGTIINLFGGIFSAGIILVISFYLTVQEKGLKKFFISVTPNEHQSYVSDLIDRIEAKIGGWLRGQLVLMLIIGILTYIGLSLLGVKYALTLALIAGLFEIIPYIGPIVSALPAAILAFIQAPLLALLVVILYIVIQQLENYVFYPQVMKKAVGLNPILIIIVMLIGAKLVGILGIILAVPLTAGISEFFKDIRK